jgi:hypothetical protein
MPRVTSHKKNKVGTFRCDRCAEPIVAGQEFYSWAFRYGGKHYQHTSHGKVKQSQLTQSKMSGVYSAIESASDTIMGADNAADIASALNDCATEVESVKDEYQESFDNMGDGLSQGPTGQEIEEKISALEEFCETLSSEASDIESEEFDFDEVEPEEPEKVDADDSPNEEWEKEHSALEERKAEAEEEHVTGLRDRAQEALDGLSI